MLSRSPSAAVSNLGTARSLNASPMLAERNSDVLARKRGMSSAMRSHL